MSVYKGEHKTPDRVNQEYEAEIARLREREAQLMTENGRRTDALRSAEARVKELEALVRAHWSPSQADALLGKP